MEDKLQSEENVELERGVMEQTGFLLVQASAASQGIGGTVVVDIRRGDGTGGSLRAARVGVDFGSHIYYGHITMPVAADEAFIIYGEPRAGVTVPQISVRKYFLPGRK